MWLCFVNIQKKLSSGWYRILIFVSFIPDTVGTCVFAVKMKLGKKAVYVNICRILCIYT